MWCPVFLGLFSNEEGGLYNGIIYPSPSFLLIYFTPSVSFNTPAQGRDLRGAKQMTERRQRTELMPYRERRGEEGEWKL